MSNTISFEMTHAIISGPAVTAITQTLSAPTLAIVEQAGQVHVQPGPDVKHFALRADGAVIVRRGLYPRVYAILHENGHELEIHSGYCWPRLREADRVWGQRIGLPREQRDLAACLMDFPYGQIAYRRGGDLRLFMATIIRLFPAHNILIVVPGRKDLAGLAGSLTKRSQLQVVKAPAAAFARQPRRLVTTRFRFPVINREDWDLVIFSDPRCLLPEECRTQALNLPKHQLYLLRPEHVRLSKHEELLLEAAVGPVIHVGPGLRGHVATAEVHLAHSPLTCQEPNLGRSASTLERKRRLYWQHGKRNDTIAAIARAIADADMSMLWQHGLLLDHEENWLAHTFVGAPTVAIVVEAPEHARELIKLLPGWSCLTSGQQRPGGVCTRLDRVIITEVFASEQEVDADIVIVASGNALMLEATRFPRCLKDYETAYVQVVVDLHDDTQSNHHSDFPARLRAYLQAGLTVHS